MEMEEAEHHLQKIHRENVERSLDRIERVLSDFTHHYEETKKRNRRENIYVLFALGILGGYISLYPGQSIPDEIMLFGTLFTSFSFLFLLGKINTLSIDELSFRGRTINLRSNLDLVFLLSINGIMIEGLLYTLAQLLNIGFGTILSWFSFGSASVVTIIATYAKTRNERQLRRKRDRKRKKLQEIEELLFEFSELNQEQGEKQEEKIRSKVDEFLNQFGDKDAIRDLASKANRIEDVPRGLYYLLEAEAFEKPDEEDLEQIRESRRKYYRDVISDGFSKRKKG